MQPLKALKRFVALSVTILVLSISSLAFFPAQDANAQFPWREVQYRVINSGGAIFSVSVTGYNQYYNPPFSGKLQTVSTGKRYPYSYSSTYDINNWWWQADMTTWVDWTDKYGSHGCSVGQNINFWRNSWARLYVNPWSRYCSIKFGYS